MLKDMGQKRAEAPSRQAGSGRSCASFAVALREEGASQPPRVKASPTRRPNLAAQNRSVWILRIVFQNILPALPTPTRNLLRAVP